MESECLNPILRREVGCKQVSKNMVSRGIDNELLRGAVPVLIIFYFLSNLDAS